MMYTHELKWEKLFHKVSYVFHADHYLKESSKMCAAKNALYSHVHITKMLMFKLNISISVIGMSDFASKIFRKMGI